MNVKLFSLCGLACALVSCSAFDPEYAKYKREKQESAANAGPEGGDPYSNVSNPYGVPSGSPQPGSDVGQYRAEPTTPPYQPLPGVPANPNANPGYPTIPSSNPPSYPPATVRTHVVTKGDSLWGLSRKYGTSVDAIRQANGLSNDLIRVGQTLQIPR